MVNEKYAIAMAETLHYLKGINQNDIDKIPSKFMKFLKDNASQEYVCEFDYTKSLKEQSLRNETRGLIAMICLNYWCETEEQKDNFKKHLKQNEIKYQEELQKKYNINEMFKKNILHKDISNNVPISNELVKVSTSTTIKRIIDKIKKILHLD